MKKVVNQQMLELTQEVILFHSQETSFFYI